MADHEFFAPINARGGVVLPGDPSTDSEAATKGYVDAATGDLVSDDDPRLSDARTPTAHADSHASDGSDPITPADIGAATSGHTHSPSLVPFAPVTLTDGATVNTDASQGTLFRLSMGGNRTLAAPSNPADGQRAIWAVTASGADRTLTLATGSAGAFALADDIEITATASGTTDYIGAIYSSAAQRWHVVAYAKGL